MNFPVAAILCSLVLSTATQYVSADAPPLFDAISPQPPLASAAVTSARHAPNSTVALGSIPKPSGTGIDFRVTIAKGSSSSNSKDNGGAKPAASDGQMGGARLWDMAVLGTAGLWVVIGIEV